MHSAMLLWQICPSVRMSVSALVLWMHLWSNSFHLLVSPWPFLTDTAVTKFQGELPQRGVTYKGWENLQFSTEITVYVENGTTWAHRCYESLIGSHRFPIDPYRLQWTWTVGRDRYFLADLSNYVCAVRPRMTEIGTVRKVGKACF